MRFWSKNDQAVRYKALQEFSSLCFWCEPKMNQWDLQTFGEIALKIKIKCINGDLTKSHTVWAESRFILTSALTSSHLTSSVCLCACLYVCIRFVLFFFHIACEHGGGGGSRPCDRHMSELCVACALIAGFVTPGVGPSFLFHLLFPLSPPFDTCCALLSIWSCSFPSPLLGSAQTLPGVKTGAQAVPSTRVHMDTGVLFLTCTPCFFPTEMQTNCSGNKCYH